MGLMEIRRRMLADSASHEIPEYVTTETADVVSFESDWPVPMKSVVVGIEPVQDLHGYDSPWPAGGRANIWDEEWELGRFDTTTGANVASTTQIRAKNRIPVISGNTYYFVTPNVVWVQFYDTNRDIIDPPSGNYATSGKAIGMGGTRDKSFTVPEGCASVRFYMVPDYGVTYNNGIAINYPATVTTYSPYSNICPIQGWTGANVVRAGKNLIEGYFPLTLSLWNETEVYLGGVQGTTAGTTIYFPCKKGVTYYWSYKTGDTHNRSYWGAYDHFPEPGDMTTDNQNGRYTFTPNTTGYCCLYLKNAVDTTLIDYQQIEIGTAATLYEAPRTNAHIPISWQSSAGTVYGGSLDVVSGVLTVDKASVDLGTLNWAAPISANPNWFRSDSLVSTVANRNIICSHYGNVLTQSTTSSALNNAPDKSIAVNKGENKTGNFAEGILLIKDSSYSDATTFKSAMSGVQLVYELATPLTYNLTPTEVRTLLGQNNVLADTGQSTVTYAEHASE